MQIIKITYYVGIIAVALICLFAALGLQKQDSEKKYRQAGPDLLATALNDMIRQQGSSTLRTESVKAFLEDCDSQQLTLVPLAGHAEDFNLILKQGALPKIEAVKSK